MYADIPLYDAENGGFQGYKHRVMKLLSVDPANYDDAPREAIRRILEQEGGQSIPKTQRIPTDRIEQIRMGTTVATNALLERKGERCAFLVTKGFSDVLHIGNQSRPHIFDLEIRVPELLYDEVVEVDERAILVDAPFAEDKPSTDNGQSDETILGITNQRILVTKHIDSQEVRKQLSSILQKGITSIAVAFMHSYTFPDHEICVGKIAKDLGFKQVSLSHEVMPMVKLVPRGFTSCADAYLTPQIMEYIRSFQSGFDENIGKVDLSFMQSDGGLAPVDKFSGHKAILSGPAAGVVGHAETTQQIVKHAVEASKQGWLPSEVLPPLKPKNERGDVVAVVGFDMGGTSTDVSRFDGKELSRHCE